MTYISGNLRYLRKLANLSQQAFAEKVGLNRGNIASYEKGSAEPSLTNLLKITRYFGVDLLDFIDRNLTEELPAARNTESLIQPAYTGLASSGEDLTESISTHGSGNPPETLQSLTQRSIDLEKILEGLKRYHQLKISRLENLTRNGQLLRLDYARLLDIVEDVMDTNRHLIRLLSQQEQPAEEKLEQEEEFPTTENPALHTSNNNNQSNSG